MIRVGVTELHGIAQEACSNPPYGVVYTEIKPKIHFTDYIFTSKAKGVLKYFDGKDVDIIEAPIFPILTNNKWIYTPADFPTCLNFEICHIPLPKIFRFLIFCAFIRKSNFVKLIFKSNAGKDTIKPYMSFLSDDIYDKVDVIYPAVRRVHDEMICFNNSVINILYVGEFLGKGGIHVVEAFEELQKSHKNIRLKLCSSNKFNTTNVYLENKYKNIIASNPNIEIGLVEREALLNDILPNTDIFVCPTYKDSYGYAIEEAMAYGIPIISTNHFAIPEIVQHGTNGFLIETNSFEFINNFKDYQVNRLPDQFCEHMNREVYRYLKLLVTDYGLRKRMGFASLKIARNKFSFEYRNNRMSDIYHAALGL